MADVVSAAAAAKKHVPAVRDLSTTSTARKERGKSNMTKSQIIAAITAVVGLAMVIFPKVFVDLSDVKAESMGYKPAPGEHSARSPEIYRGLGVLVLFIAFIILVVGFTGHAK